MVLIHTVRVLVTGGEALLVADVSTCSSLLMGPKS
jgi:hypothetical protein